MNILSVSPGETTDMFPVYETIPKIFVADDVVDSFVDEQAAINYSINHIIQIRRGMTQQSLAAEVGVSNMVMTKMRQGQVGIPRNKLYELVDKTCSYAVLQYHATRLKLKLITKREYGQLQRDIKEKDNRIAELEQRLSMYEDVKRSGE